MTLMSTYTDGQTAFHWDQQQIGKIFCNMCNSEFITWINKEPLQINKKITNVLVGKWVKHTNEKFPNGEIQMENNLTTSVYNQRNKTWISGITLPLWRLNELFGFVLLFNRTSQGLWIFKETTINVFCCWEF